MSQASGSFLGSIRRLQNTIAEVLAPFALLVTRVVFGYALFLTGKGKLTHLDDIATYFASLGIPAAKLNAIMAAGTETVCGLLLVFGLLTRFASAGILVVMTVAALTAHSADLHKVFGSAPLFNPGALIGAAPVPYFFVALLIGVFGAGKLSLDHLLAKKIFGE